MYEKRGFLERSRGNTSYSSIWNSILHCIKRNFFFLIRYLAEIGFSIFQAVFHIVFFFDFGVRGPLFGLAYMLSVPLV